MFFRYRQAIFLEGGNISRDGLFDIPDGFLAGFTLADATWKAGTLGNPVSILAGINQHLSHFFPPQTTYLALSCLAFSTASSMVPTM